MTNMNAPDTPDIASEMGKVASVITTARRMLAEGKMVDITALESKVAELCTGAKDLSPTERVEVARAMGSLIQGLDDLAIDLKAQYAAMNDEGDEGDEGGEEILTRALDAYDKSTPKR